MRKLVFAGLLVVISVLLAACSGSATSAPDGSAKPVTIKVESNPAPAVVGDAELVFTITDASGNPVEAQELMCQQIIRTCPVWV